MYRFWIFVGKSHDIYELYFGGGQAVESALTWSVTETIFDSKFHKQYVGGEGEVVEKDWHPASMNEFKGMTYDDVLMEYRWYMRDPEATLPEEIEKHIAQLGKVQING